MDVEVNVEYCNKCGYLNKFEDLAKHIRETHPSVKVNGHEGRRASFEITVNGTLVHSKLATLAYPDYQDLSKIVSDAEEGKPVRTPCKAQPITDCVIA
ncbi:hypothetical protein NQ317_014317 [Molorchus minor]|uniref:Migration and invasion enhancer 1 n=1 Tax=Molorchus minor TaxID=1323400 RepID=A0ABQ9JXF7_9CUCU|nr:hypothetical protein NQ317_014317 [Molorchus minor]